MHFSETSQSLTVWDNMAFITNRHAQPLCSHGGPHVFNLLITVSKPANALGSAACRRRSGNKCSETPQEAVRHGRHHG